MHLWRCMVKDMMGGWRETLVKELQVTPLLFRVPSPAVTTTTAQRTHSWRLEREGGRVSCLQMGHLSLPLCTAGQAHCSTPGWWCLGKEDMNTLSHFRHWLKASVRHTLEEREGPILSLVPLREIAGLKNLCSFIFSTSPSRKG